MANPATSHDEPRSLGLAGMLEILKRRRALALLPFVFVLTAAASLALFLPGLWTANAMVLVDRQQIPEAFVKSTVTGDLDTRLLTLSQDILSRSRLMAIVDHYNLYPWLRGRQSPDRIAERMRKDIKIGVRDSDRERRNPDSASIAFTISYAATDPRLAAMVTNTLAALYIQENTRFREQQAASTSEFLDAQLKDIRAKLAGQERRIADYKERYLGELPEQREANLRAADRVQSQLQLATENNRRANERKQTLTQALAELDPSTFATGSVDGGLPPNAGPARLALLRQELAAMQTQYSEKYPDVVQLKEQIKALEAKVAADAAAAKSRPATAPAKINLARLAPQNAYVQSLVQQLDLANVEAKTSNDQIASLTRQLAILQRHIDNTPRREEEVAQLTRDYETTRQLFQSLLAKRGEAQIASDLEQRQKGERFRIIDPARIPDRPTGPNRLRLLLVGLALAIGASGLAVVLAENVDTSYRAVEEVRGSVGVPVLASIPRITTDHDRTRAVQQRRLAAAAVALGLLVLAGSSFAIAHNNQTLVTLLTSSEVAAAKR